ncbi:shikimate kinase [Synechococcus sp. PCC 7502]|uniref:shikimate kinase n=1 Tax=Synechococcus sp. PCC 7502 TaxID=1173263 RepID=UPI00029FA672|nr:shikimate kinase [Synechococcus sp. PCC 7502]AFY72212.1 shikimate kinase [Synechococcus sp. PCC 7502]
MLDGTNIYLIGMMGAGKSTIGKLLADRLNYRFVDTDSLVEACTKRTVAQIFAESGESGFRQIEHQVLSEVSAYTRLVVATGGGIVLDRLNWSHLRNGLVVWLDVSMQQLYHRLRSSHHVRPLLETADPLATLTKLYEQRRSLYAQADVCLVIDTDDSPQKVCDRLVADLARKINPDQLRFPINS